MNPLLNNLLLFASREFDFETGLYYNRARYLDPTTGRWTTQDPLGFAAGDANLYRYVGNTATMATDPSGLDEFWLFNRPWDIPGEAWSLLFPPRSRDYLASPIHQNFNPNQTNRPVLKAGDIIDADTRDWHNQNVQALKSHLAETGIHIAVVITPAMLEMTATKYIEKFRQAGVRDVFPGQYLNTKVKDIQTAAQNGDKAAQTAWKLLTNGRWWKPGIQ